MYYSSNTFKLRISVVSAFFLGAVSIVAFQEVSFAHLFSNVAQDFHRQGYQEQLKGNYKAAMNFYYRAASAEPTNSSYHNDLGLVYEHMDMLDNAEQSYLAAIKANPQYLPPYANLGYFYKKKQNLAKAVHFFQKRIELGDPRDPWTKKAAEEFSKLCNSSPYLKERFMKAETKRLDRQASRRAQRQFEEQVRLAKAEYRRGLQLLKKKKPQEALRAFDSSLAFAPGNPRVIKARKEAARQSRHVQVAQRVDKAMQMIDEGNERAAKQQFNQILAIIPNQPK